MRNEQPNDGDELDTARNYWDAHARRDPLWAVLSSPETTDRQWVLQQFMGTGEREISLLFYELDQLGIRVRSSAALDFGCGVGRLTQALARRFTTVVGLDVSPEMLALANRLNRYRDVVEYRVSGLSVSTAVADLTFDFIYSNIVLQHVPPDTSRRYLTELMRALAPGGVFVFQLPSHRADAEQSTHAPMPPAAYNADLALLDTLPATVPKGGEVPVPLRVRNASSISWDHALHGPVNVGNHWLRDGGEMVIQDDARSSLPRVLSPNAARDVLLVVRAPADPGAFQLEIDLVHEGVTWFADRGSRTIRVPIVVDSSDAVVPKPHGNLPEAPLPTYTDAELMEALPPMGQTTSPGPFPMHAIERHQVERIIAESGCRLMATSEDDRARPEWIGYRYVVKR